MQQFRVTDQNQIIEQSQRRAATSGYQFDLELLNSSASEASFLLHPTLWLILFPILICAFESLLNSRLP
jgi:hypothetical protein